VQGVEPRSRLSAPYLCRQKAARGVRRRRGSELREPPGRGAANHGASHRAANRTGLTPPSQRPRPQLSSRQTDTSTCRPSPSATGTPVLSNCDTPGPWAHPKGLRMVISTLSIRGAGPMGSGRESLVAVLQSWVRRVHIGTNGTRLAHRQFSGQPAVGRRDRIPELPRQRPLPEGTLGGGGQFRRGAPALPEGNLQGSLPPLGLHFPNLFLGKSGAEGEVRVLARQGPAPRRRPNGPTPRKGAADHPVVIRVPLRDHDQMVHISRPRIGWRRQWPSIGRWPPATTAPFRAARSPNCSMRNAPNVRPALSRLEPGSNECSRRPGRDERRPQSRVTGSALERGGRADGETAAAGRRRSTAASASPRPGSAPASRGRSESDSASRRTRASSSRI
jgi:hypothetical protein